MMMSGSSVMVETFLNDKLADVPQEVVPRRSPHAGPFDKSQLKASRRALECIKVFFACVRGYLKTVNNIDEFKKSGKRPNHDPDDIIWPTGQAVINQSRPGYTVPSPIKGRGVWWILKKKPESMMLNVGQVLMDEHDHEHFVVRKQASAYELFMLKQPFCFLIPHLYNWCMLKDGSCVLEFEYLEEVCSWPVSEYDFICHDDDMNHQILEAAVCTLHLFCGLWYLHSSIGMVHSNISPRNIMYCLKDQLWKIVNFNQAMPIEKSLHTARTAGTESFCAPEIAFPGIFTTSSDVFSLAMTLFELWFRPLGFSLRLGCGDQCSHKLFFRFAPILKRIFNSAPTDRPSAREVIHQLYTQYIEASAEFPSFRFEAADRILPLIRKIVGDEPYEVLGIPNEPSLVEVT